MKLEIELWHVLLTLISFFGCIGAFGKVLLDQVEKRQIERAAAQDKAREDGQKALKDAFSEHLAEERRNASALQNLERDFLKWQADLPIHYVRREDYVRGQSVIEAKLDVLFAQVQLVQIKGAQQHA